MNNQRYPFNYPGQCPGHDQTHPPYHNYSEAGIQNLQSTYYHQSNNPRMLPRPGQISMFPMHPPPPFGYFSQQNVWNVQSTPPRMNNSHFQNIQHPTYVHPQPQPPMYQHPMNDQSPRVPVVIHYHNNSSKPSNMDSSALKSMFVPPMPPTFRPSSSATTTSQPVNKNVSTTTLPNHTIKTVSSEMPTQNSKPLPKWLKDEIQRIQGGTSTNSNDFDDHAIFSDSIVSNLVNVGKSQTCGYDHLLDDLDEEYQPDDDINGTDYDMHEDPIKEIDQLSPSGLEELQKGKLLKIMTEIMLNVTTRMIAKSCQDVLQNFTKVSSITVDEEDTVEVVHSTSGLAALQDASSSDDENSKKFLNSSECAIGRIVSSLAADYDDDGLTPTSDNKTENNLKMDNLEEPVSNNNVFKDARLSSENYRISKHSTFKLESSKRYSDYDSKKKLSTRGNHGRRSRSGSSKGSRLKKHSSSCSSESKETHRKSRRTSRDRSR